MEPKDRGTSSAGQCRPVDPSKPPGSTTRPTIEQAKLLRQRFSWLERFTDDELREITLTNDGEPLREGMQYFDISRPEQGIFAGREGVVPPRDASLVRQGDVPPRLWSKLTKFP
jgi:hypothetical protein